jgi:glycosyltransferase involved in cell wall biosynthesis
VIAVNYLLLTEYFPASEKAELTGGVESRYFFLVKQLSKQHNVMVICSKQPGQPRVSNVFGAKVIRCGPEMPYSGKGNILNRFKFAFRAYQVGKRLGEELRRSNQKFDCVEGASFLVYPPAYFLGKKFKTIKVATWHECWIGDWIKHKGNLTGIFGELWERFSVRLRWDKVIAVSNFTKQVLIKNGIPRDKTVIIPNGINANDLKNIHSQPKYKDPTICYFGRLNWQKNVDLLIKAIPIIKKRIPNIQCKIIGNGPAEQHLKELVSKLELQKQLSPNQVTFSGPVSNYPELISQAKRCHLFVSPSTLEGFGITVIEAMSLELPYVITDIPPFVEITNAGKGGEIFRKNDADDLALKAVKLLQNKKLFAQKIKEGKALSKNYEWKNIAKLYSLICEQ